MHTGSYELDTVFPVVLVGKLMADPLEATVGLAVPSCRAVHLFGVHIGNG